MKQLFVDYRDAAVTEPVTIDPAGTGLAELADRIETFGFGVAVTPAALQPHRSIELIAEAWSLGEPYVPQLYRLPGGERFSTTSVDVLASADGTHPGLQVQDGQAFHVDGLIDRPEEVPVVLLYCVRPAESGGRTVLFNSTAAFHRLRSLDPAAASALTAPTVLRRTSSLPGVPAHRDGPAFRVLDDGSISGRYADGATETWTAAPGQAGDLRRALSFLRSAGRPGTGYVASLHLQAGQCLVMRNDRLSHGREAYHDAPGRRRHLVRCVYGRTPR